MPPAQRRHARRRYAQRQRQHDPLCRPGSSSRREGRGKSGHGGTCSCGRVRLAPIRTLPCRPGRSAAEIRGPESQEGIFRSPLGPGSSPGRQWRRMLGHSGACGCRRVRYNRICTPPRFEHPLVAPDAAQRRSGDQSHRKEYSGRPWAPDQVRGDNGEGSWAIAGHAVAGVSLSTGFAHRPDPNTSSPPRPERSGDPGTRVAGRNIQVAPGSRIKSGRQWRRKLGHSGTCSCRRVRYNRICAPPRSEHSLAAPDGAQRRSGDQSHRKDIRVAPGPRIKSGATMEKDAGT